MTRPNITYPDDWKNFQFDGFLTGQYEIATERLSRALREIDAAKQHEYIIEADTGNYWEKYASISGKLYLLKNRSKIAEILQSGWTGFASRIVNDRCQITETP